jgi:hypothetical protein
MEINCTSCGARIPASDVNLDRMVAKCGICDSVFDFSEQLAAATSGSRQRRRAPVGLPARMKILVDESLRRGGEGGYRRAERPTRGDLVIQRRWFDPAKHLFLLLFCVAWDGFLVVWYGALLSGSPGVRSGGSMLMAYLFPLLHVSVGVFLTYTVIAGLFNTTEIGLRGDAFFVRHGPIPWRGNRTLGASTIKQLFCQEKISRSKNGETRTYQLSAILDDDGRLALVGDLPELEQALFLEQALEERLGIVDVEVVGEV